MEMLTSVEVLKATAIEFKIKFPTTIFPRSLSDDRSHFIKPGPQTGLRRCQFHRALQ
jgi:hypothetical protein